MPNPRRKPYLTPQRYARWYFQTITKWERMIARKSTPADERDAARAMLAVGQRKLAAYKRRKG